MPQAPSKPPSATVDRAGLFSALGAFMMFGLFPVYFKSVADVLALEVLAHRIIWSGLLLIVGLLALSRWHLVRAVLNDRRQLGILFVSALLIAGNWGLFIWAIAADRVLESSLGYYINPLVNVALGVVFLNERLNAKQWAAIGLALAGVLVQLVLLGYLPWVALVLALTFGLYGFVRKKVKADPMTGLAVETLMLSPLAIVYLVWLSFSGTISFGQAGIDTTFLLLAAGIVTTLPLLLFTQAARRLPLSTLGIVQYITPTGHFLLAIFAYGEEFKTADAITFALIWLGLAVFTWDGIKRQRRARLTEPV